MIRKLLARFGGWRLQYILIISFALITAITIITGALITYSVIRSYLDGAADARVGRDMDLANAFYNNKLGDISSMADRISSVHSVRRNLAEEGLVADECTETIEQEIDNEMANLPESAQRFVVVTDAQGRNVAGRVVSNGHLASSSPDADWSSLPLVNTVLTSSQAQSSAEVIPANVLRWLGLDDQARISLLDTPKAAPEPFDPREGTAGLVLASAAPVLSDDGELLGVVLVGHLFNNDFTLVDRIKQVAGVDTVTIFFGDLRVSTNVLDEAGERAIGTRVSQEVYDKVLIQGEEYPGRAFVVNQWYITRYEPLYDHLNNIVGILYVGAKEATFNRLVESFAHRLLFIAAATVLLAILIAIPLALSISRPLKDLAGATQRVALGDWAVRAPVEGYEEMRTLAESFNTMVQTLKETQEQLVQKEKLASVGQLAAGVAHEINNPLGSVLLYADILYKETPEEDQQQQEDLQMIIREATRCKTIVNDLLNFSRQNEVMAQATDLNAMLRELAEESAKQELFENIQITTDLEPGLTQIQADPLQLHQVFVNLMSNAAEAMPNGGELTLQTQQGPGSGFVTVHIQDTGVGIPEENMKKLFTPFFTTKPIGRGTGLGLAIIYGIVKMHRGQISVKSTVGKGTTFTITLREKLPISVEPTEGSFVLQ
jgi:two-component system NtrC family sensor kinase